MKNKLILTLALIALAIISCDKIKIPQENVTPTVAGTSFITKSNSAYSNYHKTLLEDYTGHKCGNCPPAAVLAASLEAIYTTSLVVIAVHSGDFAKVKLPDYPASYTTTAGFDWDSPSGFGISGSLGNPNGMVNRKAYPGYSLVHKDTWGSTVALGMADPFIVRLDVTTHYDTVVRALNTDIKATFKAGFSPATKISMVLTEDGVIGNQTDYSKNPDLVTGYVFDHLLRGAVNGSWGADLTVAPALANDSVKLSYNNFALDTAFRDKHISVVVFAYNAATREVIQVEKVKIR